MRWQVVEFARSGRVRRVLARDVGSADEAMELARRARAGGVARAEPRVQWPALTDAQKLAVVLGSMRTWLGARETGVQGSAMVALEGKGLAVTRVELKPWRRLVYRLTSDGDLVQDHLSGGEIAARLLAAQAEDPRALPAERSAPVIVPCPPPEIDFDALYPPLPSVGVKCRCPGCGETYEDAVPHARCPRCWTSVDAVCLSCQGDRVRVINPDWPGGTEPHVETCADCGGTGVDASR